MYRGVLVVALLLWCAACVHALPDAGTVLSEERVRSLLSTSGVDERCTEMILRDRAAAARMVALPMNAYDLYDACALPGSFPPQAQGGGHRQPHDAGGTAKGGVAVFLMLHQCEGAAHLLSRLVYRRWVRVAIHMDASSPAAEHRCVKGAVRTANAAAGFPFAHYIEDATDVEWGSWSMVEAEFRAMVYFARLDPAEFAWSHFLVMSGADYPIVSARALRRFFARRDLQGKSFYYENTLPDETRALMLTELVSSCSSAAPFLVHLGFRAEVPPPDYFVASNTWKFFARAFVTDLVEDRDNTQGLMRELLRLTLLTPSVDELLFTTVHKRSRHHCSRMASSLAPRDFYTMYWPGDDSRRDCSPRIVGAPVEWYCPKRPYTLGVADFPRIPFGISLFVRKVPTHDAHPLRRMIDAYVDGNAAASADGLSSFTDAGAGVGLNGVRVRITNAGFEFSARFADPRAASHDQPVASLPNAEGTTYLQWGWHPRAATGGEEQGPFVLANCTGPATAPLRAGSCIASSSLARHDGAAVFCRIALAARPGLCLSLKDAAVTQGNLVGVNACADYVEPQIFSFVNGQLQLAALVSLRQHGAVGGLCATRDRVASGLMSFPVRPCNERSPEQQVCVSPTGGRSE